MPKIIVGTYYLSDKAYNHLIHLAQIKKYVSFGSARVKGLSTFLNELATFELLDTRPDNVKKRHEEQEALGRAPTWLHHRQRRARSLSLTDDAIQRYFKVAFEVGIIQNEPFIVGGPSRLTPIPSVAYVLEGIGLEWLTPKDLPTKLLAPPKQRTIDEEDI